MKVLNESDLPALRGDRKMLERLVVFFLAGNSVEHLPSGVFKVDPETFMVVIPGEATMIGPYHEGTALFQKEWAGAKWVCDWFDLEEWKQ